MNVNEEGLVAIARENILSQIKLDGGFVLCKAWLYQTEMKEFNLNMKAAYEYVVANMIESGELEERDRDYKVLKH